MIRILFLLIFSAVFFNFFCEVGKKLRLFLFSHFSEKDDDTEVGKWTLFWFRVKMFFITILIITIALFIGIIVYYFNYRWGMGMW